MIKVIDTFKEKYHIVDPLDKKNDHFSDRFISNDELRQKLLQLQGCSEKYYFALDLHANLLDWLSEKIFDKLLNATKFQQQVEVRTQVQ